MKLINKLATAAAVATVTLGAGATAASAYSISGGAYVGVATVNPTYTFGGVYTHTCTGLSFAGSATGAATTSFTPSLSGCSFLGFPVNVNQSGDWNLKVIDDDGFGTYYAELEIPAGVTTTFSSPILGCSYTVSGPQTFRNGVGGSIEMLNVGSRADLAMTLSGFAYTATNCPFSSASNGVFTSNGPIQIPGVTVS